MRKIVISLLCLCASTIAFADEQSELQQAIRQLESSKQALIRAEQQAKVGLRSRVYFDYRKAQQEIQEIERGINQFINSSRSQPRDPSQIRTLTGDYMRSNK
ncbi:integrative conjugative element protein, RAQPRD family [[Pasteurella] aerogenes]